MMMMITLTSGQRILTRSHRRGEADFSWGKLMLAAAVALMLLLILLLCAAQQLQCFSVGQTTQPQNCPFVGSWTPCNT